MEDRSDADRAAEVMRVASEGEQGVRSGTEEERIDHARIAVGERIERVREGEDDVTIRNGEQLGAARGEPPLLGECLALRAMAIAAGVVRDPPGAAAVTRLPMPAQAGGAAGRDRSTRRVLDLRETVRATIPVAVRPHDVRELKPRRDARDRRAHRHGTHGLALRRRSKPFQEIARRAGSHLRVARQPNGAGRGADVPVPEQPLNGVEVDA